MFDQIQQQVHRHGYLAHRGQIINASPVETPVQRDRREDADTVRDGTMLLAGKPYKRAQRDVVSGWTKKHGKNHTGYKLDAGTDKR